MKLILIATTDIPTGTYSVDDLVYRGQNLSGDTIELSVEVVTPVEPPPSPPPPPPPPPVSPPPPPPPPPPPSTGVGIKMEVISLGMAAAYIDYSTPPDGLTIAGTAWTFGDGTTAADASGQHLYDKPGSYLVTETVTYSDGSTAMQGIPIVVGLVPVVLPDGLSVLYHLDSNQFVEGVDWDFGDGMHTIGGGPAGVDADGRHPYSAAGTYTVKGIVRYKNSDRADAITPVTVTVGGTA